MHAARSTYHRDIGPRIHQHPLACDLDRMVHQLYQRPCAQLLGANLDQIDIALHRSPDHLKRIGNAVTSHNTLSASGGICTTHSLARSTFSYCARGISTAMSFANSSRTPFGRSTT